MYEFSRELYRDLAREVVPRKGEDLRRARRLLLAECEAAMVRLGFAGSHFASPVQSLFGQIRDLFPMTRQGHVYDVVESRVTAAVECVEAMRMRGMAPDGSPLACGALTRTGSPCPHTPRPGHHYCAYHRHLDEKEPSPEEMRELAEQVGVAI
jgi:hypothetical protein